MSRSNQNQYKTLFFILAIALSKTAVAQPAVAIKLDSIARMIMTDVRFAGLTTIDSLGYPNTRTMDALPPTEQFQVWLATNPSSRKVRQIMMNPAVSLYYAQSDKGNYVTLIGTATLVNDPAYKDQQWRAEWAEFYPSKNDMILIKIEPIRLEVVSYEHGIISESKDWKSPTLKLQKQ